MRILELRFKNLNSLYGEWLIDFTDPEYISNGIFALTGPTGAGKSTILDAICLALYGSTPRLGKITKSGNEIMSRQTGECFAEVVFESQAGKFRCHWAQHRARKKYDGDLQNPKHEIAESGSDGTLLESQTRRVSQVIEEKTGMDFDRFTRSILLAQGGFDTFLKADAEQKSKILEQITGTEIYSEISCRVHERKRDEREQLNLLQAETSGIIILDSDQEKEIQLSLDETQKQEKLLAIKSKEISEAITWLRTINELKVDINKLSEKSDKLKIDINIFQPERDVLDLAIKAALLDGEYATLSAIRKQQSADYSHLKIEEDLLPELEALTQIQVESLNLAEQNSIKAKQALTVATPLIQQVRSLDQRLGEQNRVILEEDVNCKKTLNDIDANKHVRLTEQTKRSESVKHLKVSENYLKAHIQDEWLISGLAGVEEQLTSLLNKKSNSDQKELGIIKAEKLLNQQLKNLDECTKQREVQKLSFNKATKNIRQTKEALDSLLNKRLLREYRTEKETLLREMAFLSKISELEDYRDKLEDGKECPLCGSKDHPFALGNVPVVDEIEQKIESLSQLITKAEYFENSITTLERAESKALQELTDSEKLETHASHDKKLAEKTFVELKQNLKILHDEFYKLKQGVVSKLVPLGINDILESQISSLIESLKNRLKDWKEQTSKKEGIENQIAVIDSELKKLDAIIEIQNTAFAGKKNQLEDLKNKYVDGCEKRKKMYADKKPNEEENQLNKAIDDAEKVEKNSRDNSYIIQQKLMTAKDRIESLNNDIKQRNPDLKQSESNFDASLIKTDFTNESCFLDAQQTTEKKSELFDRAKVLDDAKNDIKIRTNDRESQLSKELSKKLTDKTLAELDPRFREYEANIQNLNDTISGLKHQLRENAAAKNRIKEKQGAIDTQKKECHRWEKLHYLIGSADGKKYRNFAQGLTFELMVSHANQQLAKMSERYLLIRDHDQPLELNVVDSYQAGEIRSTKNLSGGESFIVSLTLALGLSKMASKKVRVDSLFLDEGFGTLDEDSLEIALETLSSLQQDGKLIGVISHVNALKERISTQIKVIPKSAGQSLIQGPGCTVINNT